MSVAKFVAANGREAMRKVREAMGPDAVVLSNRSIDGGVEIVAMRGDELGAVSAGAQLYVPPAMGLPAAMPAASSTSLPSSLSSSLSSSMPSPQAMLQSLNDMHPAASDTYRSAPSMPVMSPMSGIGALDEPMLGDLRGELASMRSMLERQFAGLGNGAHGANGVAAGDPLRESLFEWMVNAGFSGQLSRTLLARLPVGTDRPAAMAWIRQELAQKVPVLANEDTLFAQGGVLALIGPTGVGKTTTTAKLAARFVLRHGPQSLALLTTDRFRIGAHEQLRIYGDILGVPVHAVKDAADLRFALSAMKDKHLVIIDTVGMSQRDRSLSDQISMLAGVQAPMQRVLLLNGAAHGDTLNEVVHAYRNDTAGAAAGIDGCIISKLDEATHLGSVLDVVIRHRLPVYYASTGQRVPEHLELAEAHMLVERAFMTPRRGSLFNDADVARRQAANAANAAAASAQAARESERSGADDMLVSLTDSATAVGVCVEELNAQPYGFEQARQLWQLRAAGASALRPLVQQVRLAMCRDASRACDRYVLTVTQSIAQSMPGRRAPQMMHHTLWLADRDGMPLACTVAPAGRMRQSLSESEADVEADTVRATLAAARPIVHLNTSLPAPAVLARWQQQGERWVAGTRKTTRVIADGAANKLDTIADTLTFHAIGEVVCRDRDASHWVAHCLVRIPDGQVRAAARGRANGAESGIEACLVVSRMVDHETGNMLAVEYLLCDPALADDAVQVARWSRYTVTAEDQFRTVRHAIEHFAQDGDAEGQQGGGVVSLQLGLTTLRLQHTPTPTAPAFLSRLTGRASARVNAPVSGAVLNEGLGRLLALLDVLENYPGRSAAPAAIEATEPEAPAMSAAHAMAAMDQFNAMPQLAATGE